MSLVLPGPAPVGLVEGSAEAIVAHERWAAMLKDMADFDASNSWAGQIEAEGAEANAALEADTALDAAIQSELDAGVAALDAAEAAEAAEIAAVEATAFEAEAIGAAAGPLGWVAAALVGVGAAVIVAGILNEENSKAKVAAGAIDRDGMPYRPTLVKSPGVGPNDFSPYIPAVQNNIPTIPAGEFKDPVRPVVNRPGTGVDLPAWGKPFPFPYGLYPMGSRLKNKNKNKNPLSFLSL